MWFINLFMSQFLICKMWIIVSSSKGCCELAYVKGVNGAWHTGRTKWCQLLSLLHSSLPGSSWLSLMYQILVQMSLPHGSFLQLGWMALDLHSHYTPHPILLPMPHLQLSTHYLSSLLDHKLHEVQLFIRWSWFIPVVRLVFSKY